MTPPTPTPNAVSLQEFVAQVERAHFRTNQDIGANGNTMLIWNLVRAYAGLPRLEIDELPAYCQTHDTYHRILESYGCKRKTP